MVAFWLILSGGIMTQRRGLPARPCPVDTLGVMETWRISTPITWPRVLGCVA